MIRSADGGATWTNDTVLDNLMTGAGTFQYRPQRGALSSSTFGRYAQPSLIAFNPQNPDVIIAGAKDSGVFLSLDDGATWSVLTNNSGLPANPVVPRPKFAYFDDEGGDAKIYVATQGRGVLRMTVTSPPRVSCLRIPGLCGELVFDKDIIVIRCDKTPCIVHDPIPKNCLYKWGAGCPGCSAGGMCPPFYHIYVEKLPRNWSIEIVGFNGKAVEHKVARTTTGAVVSMQPSKRLFRSGKIGPYYLVLRAPAKAKRGEYKFPTRVEIGDKPYVVQPTGTR
jgi:hypothetical protein